MGFFDSIKKIVLKKSTEKEMRNGLEKIDTTELGVLTKVVNLTLDNYRKSIDKISTKVSNVEYENDFYNDNTNMKKINNIEVSIKEINEEINKIQNKNKKLKESIHELMEEIIKNQVQLDKLKKEEKRLKTKKDLNNLNDEDKEDFKADILNIAESTKLVEEKVINLKVKVDVSTMDIRSNEELICNHIHEIQKMKNEKLCFMTLSNSIEECLEFAENIEEKTPFTRYCFKGILDYNRGNLSEALEKFDRYFKEEDKPYKNYYIRQMYAKLLMKSNRYEEAKQYAMEALRDKPEEAEIHKILSKVHKTLGEEDEMELEDAIVGMIEG